MNHRLSKVSLSWSVHVTEVTITQKKTSRKLKMSIISLCWIVVVIPAVKMKLKNLQLTKITQKTSLWKVMKTICQMWEAKTTSENISKWVKNTTLNPYFWTSSKFNREGFLSKFNYMAWNCRFQTYHNLRAKKKWTGFFVRNTQKSTTKCRCQKLWNLKIILSKFF